MKRQIQIFLLTITCLGLTFCGSNKMEKSSVPEKKAPVDVVKQEDQLPVKIDSFKLAIYPPSTGVQFYNNGILFLSPSKNQERMIPDHISFGTIEAYYTQEAASIPEISTLFSPSSLFNYPCEALTFTSDYKTMYYTRIPKKDTKEKIYKATYVSQGKKKAGWISEDAPLEFCLSGQAYSHPALSPDGNMMVFASDIGGGAGKMDLYVSMKEADKWSAPKNLGNIINTSGDESYPFIDSRNNLFFSSNGLKGYGGYDIFVSRFNGKSWDFPVNLSSSVNSAKEDIAFTMDSKTSTLAFYSTIDKQKDNNIQLFSVTPGAVQSGNSMNGLADILYSMGLSDKSFTYNIQLAQVAAKEPATTQPEKKEEVKQTKPVAAAVPVVEKGKPAAVVPAEKSEVVIYRVQLLSSVKPRGSTIYKFKGVSYKTYEYLYNNAYRTTIGEFNSYKPALDLQNELRRSGVKDAFVVAFKNNVRSLDTSLFK